MKNAWDKGYFGEAVSEELQALQGPEGVAILAAGVGSIAVAYAASLIEGWG
ncbi:hypothetical protein [Gimesia panareensis]|uniref:hypothetical protein n=1 Tax=Gimesia panareensis TaxID=2527978 RepID=UPI0018D7478B|nr:hypothetical protein [Gimesia panareensis]